MGERRPLRRGHVLELASPILTSCLSHWPMHGPHALASTSPPTFSNASIWPSRSMVARTCSDPGVMVNLDFVSMPCAAASSAMDAERVMSSYEELVHEP